MDDDDISIEVRIDGERYKFTPQTFALLPKTLRTIFQQEFRQLASDIKFDLKTRYQMVFRERKRIDGLDHLEDRINQAMTSRIDVTGGDDDFSIQLGIFDLDAIDRLTRNEGRGTDQKGWFMFFEDGHVGKAHGSFRYGFVTKEEAVKLAEACAERFGLNPEKRSAFILEVENSFAGKHDEGIMVNIKRPLFREFPDFGTPADHGIDVHKGYEAFNVIATFDGPGQEKPVGSDGNSRWIDELTQRVMRRAVRQLNRGV